MESLPVPTLIETTFSMDKDARSCLEKNDSIDQLERDIERNLELSQEQEYVFAKNTYIHSD